MGPFRDGRPTRPQEYDRCEARHARWRLSGERGAGGRAVEKVASSARAANHVAEVRARHLAGRSGRLPRPCMPSITSPPTFLLLGLRFEVGMGKRWHQPSRRPPDFLGFRNPSRHEPTSLGAQSRSVQPNGRPSYRPPPATRGARWGAATPQSIAGCGGCRRSTRRAFHDRGDGSWVAVAVRTAATASAC
jgi:hypothetical protein